MSGRGGIRLTSSFQFGFDQRLGDVRLGWEAVVRCLVGDGDVGLAEHLADCLGRVPVEQIVGADDHHAAPVVLR